MKTYTDTQLYCATEQSNLIEREPLTGISFDNHLRAAVACRTAATCGQLLHPRVLQQLLFSEIPRKNQPGIEIGPPCDDGNYRTLNVYVHQSAGRVHTFPPPTDIPALMDEWWSIAELYQPSALPVRPPRAGLTARLWDFHAWFESIHPFIDGNGRTGRLLWWSMMMLGDVDLDIITYENRLAYYDRLEVWREINCNKPLMNPFK